PLLLARESLAAIVSLNEENNDWVKERFGSVGIHYRVISNSISADFAPKSSLDSKILMAAGRLAPAKQFDHLIEAFSQIAKKYPDWVLRIFGSGPEGNKLRGLIAKYNLFDQVQILPAVESLQVEWAKASIHVMASRSEGQSLVILEAANSFVPTLAYDCPTGPRNLIEDGVNGRLVELNSIMGLASAMEELILSKSLRKRLGAAARESVMAYSPATISRLWNDLLHDTAKKPQPAEDADSKDVLDLLPTSGAYQKANKAERPKVETKAAAAIHYSAESIDIERAKVENYQFVRGLLESKDISFVPIETYGYYRHALAIREDDLDLLLDAFLEISAPNIAVRCKKGNARLVHRDWYPARGVVPYQLSEADVFRIFNHYSDPLDSKIVGAIASTDIELWHWDSDAEVYKAPRHNRSVDQLLGTQFEREAARPSTPLWSSVTFPIDVVYTWVDDTDVDWQERKRNHLPLVDGLHPMATSSVRFRNRDELKYSIRSLRMFAPWVNNIYIVTDKQRPGWLADESDIVVVDHRELFPDAASIPTFNSHAIESVLHRIPDLAEHFLYLNDDVMFMRYQDPETYFYSNGIAKFFHSPVKIADLGDFTEPHMWAAVNNRQLLNQRFDRLIAQSMLHTPHPHRKSILKKIEKEFPDIFSVVRLNRFRSSDDISLLSSFAQHYGYFVGSYAPGSIRYTYCAIGSANSRQRFRELAVEERFDVLALGESNSPELSEEDADGVLSGFFASKFPVASRDESNASKSLGW
ncbi:stealth conserved region 3 domain-containing protein, partial [Glutamicibacter sp. AOP5-B1-3]